MSKVIKWAMAAMEFEGYGKGSISYNNNNPGNLKVPSGIGRVTGNDQFGHSIFSDFRLGWNALVDQLTSAITGKSRTYHPSMSIGEFYVKYSQGNSSEYA